MTYYTLPFIVERRPLILYGVKKQVASFLSLVDAKHLAQTLVKGYYTMLGHECDSVVMPLTTRVHRPRVNCLGSSVDIFQAPHAATQVQYKVELDTLVTVLDKGVIFC